MPEQKIPGDGVVTGSGTINGRLVYVYARISPFSAGRCIRSACDENLQGDGQRR
jgi:acetyl-CoA carboxylase carboxyltransferase component